MEYNRILIIDQQTVRTCRNASLCGDCAVWPMGVMHDVGLVQEGGRQGVVIGDVVKCVEIGSGVGKVKRGTIHIDRVDQVSGIGGNQELGGGESLYIDFSGGTDGSSFAGSDGHDIVVECECHPQYVVLADMGKGEGVGTVVIVVCNATGCQRHTADMVAFIRVETEGDGGVPGHYEFMAVPSIGYDVSVLCFRNLNAVGEMSEKHINHVVGKNGEDGLGKCRLGSVGVKVIRCAVNVQTVDAAPGICSYGIGDLVTFVYGGGGVGCGHAVGGYGEGSSVIGIDGERIDCIGRVGANQEIIDVECIALAGGIGNGDILCVGRHIVLVHQP